EQGSVHSNYVFAVPSQGHFTTMFLVLDFLQSVTADEVVVELDERTVTDFVRSDVVVFDVVGNEGTTDGASSFIGVVRQPLAVGLHAWVGVHSRQRARDPAGFQSVGRICARTYWNDTELGTSFQ